MGSASGELYSSVPAALAHIYLRFGVLTHPPLPPSPASVQKPWARACHPSRSRGVAAARFQARRLRWRCADAQRAGVGMADHGAAAAAAAAAPAAGTMGPAGARAVGGHHCNRAAGAHHCARAVCRRASSRRHHAPTSVGAVIPSRIRRFPARHDADLGHGVVRRARLFCRARGQRGNASTPPPPPMLPPMPPRRGARAGRVGNGGALLGPQGCTTRLLGRPPDSDRTPTPTGWCPSPA